MPNLFNNLRECLGFSHIIKSQSLKVLIALSDMSFKLPIGVATIYISNSRLFILFVFILLISCSPVNLEKPNQEASNKVEVTEEIKVNKNLSEEIKNDEKINQDSKFENKIELVKNIILLVSNKEDEKFVKQLVNILELGIYNKKLQSISIDIKKYRNDKHLEEIVANNQRDGQIYIGPISNESTKTVIDFCNYKVIFFSFSSEKNLAKNCVYLVNFFPKNELEKIFESLDDESKVALLYPENKYGYTINSLIDDVVNNSKTVLVNRSSYKNDLSNVRDSIKELGKYELRKYELERQKIILSNKKDEVSKKRLKKLKKFNTTSDYDFTHILIADYGLNLLQVAPLLPYYDIDPNLVQFIGTGVMDDENFFFEPSLQGAIFPGIEIDKRLDLINQYQEIYEDKMMRISTLPYDLLGLLNYVFNKNMSYSETINLLNNSKTKFEGVDGEFYFKRNMIERNLSILKISNGKAIKLNR